MILRKTKLIADCQDCGADGDVDGVLIHVLDATFDTACRCCGRNWPAAAVESDEEVRS